MPAPGEVLNDLVQMSRRLGDPARDYVILGEGNTSAAVDAESFFVKASGAGLEGIGGDGFVRVRREPVIALLDQERLSDDEVREGMMAARADRSSPARPSVETL